MAGVNKVMLIGNLGRDPEIRYTPDGTAVASFSIATSREWNDRSTGEKKKQTEWHRIVAFRRLAEICGEYLSKGSQVYIEGHLQTRDWDDKEGNKRYTTEIVANQMQMLGSRASANAAGPSQYSPGPATPDQPGPQFPEPEDDDIPF